ncbi:hypothetical protein Lalb_Chr12g0205121 [Lupinus albus]|uniref:Uncharacterized protein n=1 Tax=Lupinus albus TaxID=3870 RepID=A0A6A4PNA8_LUPAL|nr:hypothetical protein Lalb_Chr12g0205121 [Lupinus albus]
MNLRVMFTGCISKAQILLVNLGIYFTVLQSKYEDVFNRFVEGSSIDMKMSSIC